MLQCIMKPLSRNLRLGLEDLLGDIGHARRSGELGRLALLSYYEVRRWARLAGEPALAEHSAALVSARSYADRDSFLFEVDRLIAELEQVLSDDRDPNARTAETLPSQAAASAHNDASGATRRAVAGL